MAAIVAPGICRFAVNGTYSGRDVVNILDMFVDTTGTTTDRAQACFNQAGRIINSWTSKIVGPMLVDNYTALEVTWVDLDSLDGSTGSRSSTSTTNWPISGNGQQTAMPGNVAFRVNKRTAAGRGAKQGRMYLAGVAENATDDTNPNQVVAAVMSGNNAKLAEFLTDVTSDQNPNVPFSDYTSQLHVVHTIGGVFESSSEVVALEMDGTLGSQRRRLR